MRVQPFILATAGHVDHGKSSLVRALTGTDPDRLPEEKARGITIDLGFAHLDLPAGTGNPHGAEGYSCGLVDVPGHEDFVRNMVAGVGSIDLAILVVAADDGWMPQTEEHLQILLYLGVTRAVVALTKIDLVETIEARSTEVRRKLEGTPLANAPLVPVSVIRNQGLDTFQQVLSRELDQTPAPADIGRPRLWIDRVFTLRGVGTVVTGSLTGGSLRPGDTVTLQPRGQTTRIRCCQTHGREITLATPGTRLALNLPDLPTAESDPLRGIRRADVVTGDTGTDATSTVDVWIHRSQRPILSRAGLSRPLLDGTRVALHLGSACASARLVLLGARTLAPGAAGPAQLRLDQPLHAHTGDRFILRDASQQTTLAGGVVLDPEAQSRAAREPEHLARLAACATHPLQPEAFIELTLARHRIADMNRLLPRSRFSSCSVSEALGRLVASQRVVPLGTWITEAKLWLTTVNEIRDRVRDHHRVHPELPGWPLSELRSLLAGRLPETHAFEEAVRALQSAGLITDGNALRDITHRATLPDNLRLAGERIRTTLAQRPLDPPARRDLAPDPDSRQAVKYLLQRGELTEIGPDLLIETNVLRRARERVRAFLLDRGAATAGQIRDHLGTTRRLAIPLLERWDREGFTRRDGDLRRLNPDARLAEPPHPHPPATPFPRPSPPSS